jgi:hypothetical protein
MATAVGQRLGQQNESSDLIFMVITFFQGVVPEV